MAQGPPEEVPVGGLERQILVHLLEHRGHVIRFEADAGTTEFGIIRKFPVEGVSTVRGALRNLEMYRWIYRRMQYVIGYSEPKLVYMLTPGGHRLATDLDREGVTASSGIRERDLHRPPATTDARENPE
jgi:hypothetical protein